MIYVLRYAVIALYTVFWGTIASVVGMLDWRGNAVPWIARQWVRWILGSTGIKVEATGLDRIDMSRTYVWMSNHQSVFDITAIVATLPVAWRFVAKRELTWIPFFGWALRMGGHVIVYRGNHEKSVASLRRAAERIAEGTHVIVFPEGTRSTEGRLGSLKSGGFHLAIEAGAPIVPITVSGSRFITPKSSLRIEPGLMRIHYGEPIPTQGLTAADRNALKRRVGEAILAGYDDDLQEGRHLG